MQGYGDPFNRLPFPWHRMNEDLLSHYRALGRLREEKTLYQEGNFALLRLDESIFAFLRFDADSCLLTCLNHGEKAFALPFYADSEILFSQNAQIENETLHLPANEAIVFSLTHKKLRLLHENGYFALPSYIKRDPLFQ